MSIGLTATKRALVIASPTPLPAGTVDVLIDGRRVWSTAAPDPDERGRVRLEWPEALHPYLRGSAVITVESSATGETLAEASVSIGRRKAPIEIRDAQGRWLAINKWNRLGPSFEGNDTGVQDRLLHSARDLVDDLEDLGYPVFAVGGTLLGALRSGNLLPHDDDIDLAWICEETNPLDIARASIKMERELVERGYTSIRLSMAHLQVTFFDQDGRTDHYVDIFTGFFMDGVYGQPFALRGELELADLLPASSIDLDGIELPAPARPEAWLEFAYGPNWRVPDPSFTFEVPRSTLRRYENWFGVFNRGRAFWEKHFERLTIRPDSTEDFLEADRFNTLIPAGSEVVDFGCADGRLTGRIAAEGHRVLGVDYSYEALRLARAAQPEAASFEYLNANDSHAMMRFALDLLAARRSPYFFINHLLEGVPRIGRAEVFLLLRAVLTDETFAYVTVDTDFSRHYVRGRPDSWHLPVEWLIPEARGRGLSAEVLTTGKRRSPYGVRSTATVILRRDPTLPIQHEEVRVQ